MKKILLLCAMLALGGCATHPVFTTIPATTNSVGVVTPPVVEVSPWLSTAISNVSAINHAVPTNVATPAVDLALGALSGVLALIAGYKSRQANQQTQAADILAGHVVAAGRSVQALKDASGAVSGVVAQHLDNNTVTAT